MTWRKSSRSGNINCVELRLDQGAVRDSKRPEVELTVPTSALRALIDRVR
ncbi:DUF397 domain-containing protein [Actinokineospora sp. NPDC004072]